MKKNSLTLKLTLVSTILVSVGFIILLLLSVNLIESKVTQAMIEQLTAQNMQIAKQAEILIEKGASVEELQSFVEETATEKSNIAYAIVIDKTVTAIAHSDTQKIGKNYSDDTGYTVPACTEGVVMTSQFWADVQNAWTYDIMYPIYANGELYGSMDVGIYNSTVDVLINVVRKSILITMLVLLVIIIALFDVYVRVQLHDFEKLTKACDAMGEGDFTFDLDEKVKQRKDELGVVAKAIQNMKDSLGKLITTINEDAMRLAELEQSLTKQVEETREKSKEIVVITQNAVEGTNQQKSISDENVRLAAEITESVNGVSDNFSNISNTATETASAAEEGSEKLNHVVTQMQKIGNNVTQTRDQIHELENMSGKIENIVEMIADIASQTNLLSLNASIEAARAGEQGKGFAVVASEVGSLAVQSSKSANDIADMIKQIQESIKLSVSLMEEGYESAQGGIELAENTKASFAGITDKIAMISDEMGNVTNVMQSAARGSEKLQCAMDEIDQIAEKVSENTNHVAAEVNEQNDQMHEVKIRISELGKLSNELLEGLRVFKI